MSTDGHGTRRRRNIAKNFNRLSRVHERYRRQTDRRTGGNVLLRKDNDSHKTDNYAEVKMFSHRLLKLYLLMLRPGPTMQVAH